MCRSSSAVVDLVRCKVSAQELVAKIVTWLASSHWRHTQQHTLRRCVLRLCVCSPSQEELQDFLLSSAIDPLLNSTAVPTERCRTRYGEAITYDNFTTFSSTKKVDLLHKHLKKTRPCQLIIHLGMDQREPATGDGKQNQVDDGERIAGEDRDIIRSKSVDNTSPPPFPLAAKRLLAIQADDWGTPEHKQDVQTCADWLLEAVRYAHSHHSAKKDVRRLLGCASFTLCLTWAEAFRPLVDGCVAAMQELGEKLSEYFQHHNLAHVLGEYNPPLAEVDVATTSSLRQDRFVPLPALEPLTQARVDRASSFPAARLLARRNKELTCIHILRLVALALNESFLKTVNAAADGLLCEPVFSASIKGFPRMAAKMSSRDDHLNAAYPRPAMNVDIVRCLGVFDTADDMRSGLEAFARAFGGKFVKLKNGMAWGEEVARSRFHLRLVLATVRFQHPQLATIGQLRNDPRVRELWDGYLDVQSQPVASSVSRLQWKQQVLEARRWLETLKPDTPISMACEIQCLLRKYRDIRMQMHEPYRLVRAASDKIIFDDFEKYTRSAERQSVFERDGATPLLKACRDGHDAWLRQYCHDEGVVAPCVRLGTDGDNKRAAFEGGEEVPWAMTDDSVRLHAAAVAAAYVRSACVDVLLRALRARSVKKVEMDIHDTAPIQILSTPPPDCASPLICACEGVSSRGGFELDEPRAIVVQKLIQAKADCNQRSSQVGGATPLFVAAQANHVSVLKQLLLAKADTNLSRTDDGSTPLHVAAQKNCTESILLLIDAKATLEAPRSDTSDTPLLAAVHNAHMEATEILLKAKANPNVTRQIDGSCPVFIAAVSNTFDVLQLLVAAKANPNALVDGCTALWMAARRGNCESVKVLLDFDADPNVRRPSDGIPPLTMAALCNSSACVELLLQAKASVANACGIDGTTALFYAAQNNGTTCLALLLDAKSNPNVPISSGATPLLVAVQKGFSECMVLLLSAKADSNIAERSVGLTPLIMAVLGGNYEMVDTLLEAKADVNSQRSDSGATALLSAVQVRHTPIIDRLLHAKANPELPTSNGVAPLWLASELNFSSAATALISGKADVNTATPDDGTSALWMSAQHGHVDTLQLLVQAKASVNAQRFSDCSTPLWIAAQNDNAQCVKCLLMHKASPNVPNGTPDGRSPTSVAATRGSVECLSTLLDAKADLESPSFLKATAVYYASLEGQRACLQLLLHANARLDCRRADDGSTCLQAAARGGHSACVTTLLQAKVDVNETSPITGSTALFEAAQAGAVECARVLLVAKANLNISNRYGTAAAVAADFGRDGCLALLLEAGAEMPTHIVQVESAPLQVVSPTHAGHTLTKASTDTLSGYAGGFSCDICGCASTGCVYHCGICGWDAHPRCIGI